MPADLVLTKRQREILEALAGGALITVNTLNIASLNGATLSPVTRAFLTQHRLIGRLDTTLAVTVSGNGFTITPKGRKALENP